MCCSFKRRTALFDISDTLLIASMSLFLNGCSNSAQEHRDVICVRTTGDAGDTSARLQFVRLTLQLSKHRRPPHLNLMQHNALLTDPLSIITHTSACRQQDLKQLNTHTQRIISFPYCIITLPLSASVLTCLSLSLWLVEGCVCPAPVCLSEWPAERQTSLCCFI